MRITKEYLQALKACKDGYEWFLEHFPEGDADYQEVLNALRADDKPRYANWLMDHVGPVVGSVLEIDDEAGEGIEAGTCIKAGWSIKAGTGIKVGWIIKAGTSIKAGWSIEAGEGIEAGTGIKAGKSIAAGTSIKAGWSIEAGEGIKAGDGFGIFAGVNVQITKWSTYGQVVVKLKPNNLISGHWVEPT